MRIVPQLTLLAAMVAFFLPAPASAEDKKADEEAKEIVRQFSKAYFAKDVDGCVMLMDVPWFGIFSEELLKDREELKKQWTQLLKARTFEGKPKSEIKEVLTFPQYREKYKEMLVNVGKALDQLKLTAEDRVVIEDSGKYGASAVLVRMRDGKPKIVGQIGWAGKKPRN